MNIKYICRKCGLEVIVFTDINLNKKELKYCSMCNDNERKKLV